MKKQVTFITLITGLLLSLTAAAHEGHDHDAPASLKAPKGGIIKSLENVHVEVVGRGKDLKIYFYDHDLKPQDIKTFTVKAKAEMPRTKKQETITLTAKDTYYEATYDAKGSHRYTLLLDVKDPKEAHSDTLKYTVEPKK